MITKPKGECRPHAPPCNKAAIRGRASSPMCLGAASRRARPWLKTALLRVGAMSPRAPCATDLICVGWVPFQDLPAARRATLRANSMTCSTAIVREPGLLSWLRSSPTLARTICWRRLPISPLLRHRTRPSDHVGQTSRPLVLGLAIAILCGVLAQISDANAYVCNNRHYVNSSGHVVHSPCVMGASHRIIPRPVVTAASPIRSIVVGRARVMA
jgi:hypothetical protein